jgi:ribosomal protein S18 acetylase RimI-like enzyme
MICLSLFKTTSLLIKTKINDLIYQNFDKSRLNTYEYLIYKLHNDEIIGFLGLDKYEEYLSINQLCVNNNYRNIGIATHLLSYVYNKFKNNNFILFVDTDNINYNNLVKFYKKRGFKEDIQINPNECRLIMINIYQQY